MASEPRTGALLAALAASKPGGRLLELGTGTGLGTAWLLSGMDTDARLDTVDTDREVVAVARRHLGSDPRVTFHVMDGADFISQASRGTVRSDLRRRVAGKVHASRRDAGAPARRRHLFHRRSAAATQLAGRPRAESPGAHRGHRAPNRVRDGEAVVGVRADACGAEAGSGTAAAVHRPFFSSAI